MDVTDIEIAVGWDEVDLTGGDKPSTVVLEFVRAVYEHRLNIASPHAEDLYLRAINIAALGPLFKQQSTKAWRKAAAVYRVHLRNWVVRCPQNQMRFGQLQLNEAIALMQTGDTDSAVRTAQSALVRLANAPRSYVWKAHLVVAMGSQVLRKANSQTVLMQLREAQRLTAEEIGFESMCLWLLNNNDPGFLKRLTGSEPLRLGLQHVYRGSSVRP